MKYILNKFIGLFCMAITLLTSCNDDQKRVIFDGAGEDYVSFLSPKYTAQLDPSMNGILKIPICRTDKTIEGTAVNIKLTKEDEAFVLSSSNIRFEKGQAQAYAEFTYDIEKLDFGATYSLHLEIQNENLSPAAQKACAISVTRKLTWKSIGEGTWTTQLFGGSFDVAFEEAVEAPGRLYRVLDMVKDNYPIQLNIDKEKGVAWASFQDTGYDAGGKRLYYNATGTYQKGVITFPKADDDHPNYYYIKNEEGYQATYYLVESFELPNGY